MTKRVGLGSRTLAATSAFMVAASLCYGSDSRPMSRERDDDRPFATAGGDCDDYPIALYPDANAQSQAELELQSLAPGASMVWHPARGTFWFVTLSVPLPQCGAGADVFAQLFGLTAAYPALFQLDLEEWESPASYPCSQVGALPQVLEIKRARVGSHPIAQDVMKFTVQRVNGVVELSALYGEYLPPAPPWLDMALSACPDLNQQQARRVVQGTGFTYSVYRSCVYMGYGVYVPDGLDTITFSTTGDWAWEEDPILARVLFTKSTQGTLVLDPSNYTRKLIQSDANCPDENGPNIGFQLLFDSVKTALISYQPGIKCIVCLR